MLDLDKLVNWYEHDLIDDWSMFIQHDVSVKLLLTTARILQEYPKQFGVNNINSFISEIVKAADERNIFPDSEGRYERIKERWYKFTDSVIPYSYRTESVIKVFLSLSSKDKNTLKNCLDRKEENNETMIKLRGYIYDKYQVYPLVPLMEQDFSFCFTLTEADIKFLKYYYKEKEVK